MVTLGVNKIVTDIIGLSSLKMAFRSTFFDSLQGKQRLTTEWPKSFGCLVFNSMLEMSMSLSYVPDTLMKQRGSFLPSIEAEIPLLSLDVAEYNGLAMCYARNRIPLLPKKGGSRSICSGVPNKTT